MRSLLAALVAATLAFTATTAQDKTEAPNLLPAFEKAFANNDADGLAALYFEEAVLLPPNEPAVVGRAEIRKWYQKLFSTGVSHFKMESRTVLYEGPVGYERGAYSVRVPGSGRNGEAARPPNGTKGESARAGGTCQIRRRELTRAAIA